VTFVKGQSGNPGGQHKNTVELRALARQHTAQAVAVLAEIMMDTQAPPSARVNAVSQLLDRGFGRPVQEVTGPDGASLLGDIIIKLVKADKPVETPPDEPGAWS
jgi:hypothetical protein